MAFQHIAVPAAGEKITLNADHSLKVPSRPVIPYIEGDGIGVDIAPVARKVVDVAVSRAYAGERAIQWMEVFAGEKAERFYGREQRLPEETLQAIKAFRVVLKGPLTPLPTDAVGPLETLNSLEVAIRNRLDLYASIRAVRYFEGAPSPLKEPERTNVVVFRECSEDLYAGIEFEQGSDAALKLLANLREGEFAGAIRFPETTALGIKPVSREGTRRLVRKALQFAVEHDMASVTVVHQGNVMMCTEGAFRNWAFELAAEEFGAEPMASCNWLQFRNAQTGNQIVIKDYLMDEFLQRVLLKSAEFDLIVSLNLNGDYISDVLAAHVGSVGIAPGAMLSDNVAIFEVSHGSVPKLAGLDRANPASMVLCAEMMLRYLGWVEAAELIMSAYVAVLRSKHVTYDLARLMDNVTEVSCSGFGDELLKHL